MIIPVIKSGVRVRQNLYGDTSTQRPEVYILRYKLQPLSRAGKEIGRIYMVTFLHKVQKKYRFELQTCTFLVDQEGKLG